MHPLKHLGPNLNLLKFANYSINQLIFIILYHSIQFPPIFDLPETAPWPMPHLLWTLELILSYDFGCFP